MNLKALAETAFQTAKGIVESGQELAPVFFVEDGNGDLNILMAPWRSTEEKLAIYQALRKQFSKINARAYLFISEAWMTKMDKGKDWDGVPPSESPDRIEVVMIDGNTRDGERYTRMVEIKTDKFGARTLSDTPLDDCVSQQGAAVNLLLPEGKQPQRH